MRGGILDIFSFSHDQPYRIEFFGDEVDSIRTFDIESQLSIETVDSIQIIPDLAHGITQTSRESLLNFLPKESAILLSDKKYSATLDKLRKSRSHL